MLSSEIVKKYGNPSNPIPAPAYTSRKGPNIGLSVESMEYHTTDEGWQLFLALQAAGYGLCGKRRTGTDLHDILACKPCTVVIQDKREWIGKTAGSGFDHLERYKNVSLLKDSGAFVVTVVKDAQNDTALHREAAEEIGCHAWITYYNPKIVAALCPCLRPQHIIRTYHTVDPDAVPDFVGSHNRSSLPLVSGALNKFVYPLRTRLYGELVCARLEHPGYRRDGSYTSIYLRELSKYRVAVCTSSIYGYALRKIIEATAAGCRVVTNLPSDERIPWIDGNLHRIESDESTSSIQEICAELAATYSDEQQRKFSIIAKEMYGYPAVGRRLAADIEKMRTSYGRSTSESRSSASVGRSTK